MGWARRAFVTRLTRRDHAVAFVRRVQPAALGPAPRSAADKAHTCDALRASRSSILAQAEELAKAGIALIPAMAPLDPVLLGHTMLSLAEMLGRLAVSDPDTHPRERLEEFARTAMSLRG